MKAIAAVPVTALDVVTLVIAALALTTSVVGVAWQVRQHRLTGPVVRTVLEFGIRNDGGTSVYPSPDLLLKSHPALVGVLLVAVRISNIGRSGVQLVKWWIEFRNEEAVVPQQQPQLQRLEPGENVGFTVSFSDLRSRADTFTDDFPAEFRACVYLATGITAYSSWLKVEDLPPDG